MDKKGWLTAAAALGFAVGAWGQDPPKPAEPAKPEEAAKPAEPPAKKRAGALGLPTSADLKTKAGFDDEQAAKADEVLKSNQDKIAEIQAKLKNAADRKAVAQEMKTLRTDIVAKLREICKDDEQRTKFDAATAPPSKKKPNP